LEKKVISNINSPIDKLICDIIDFLAIASSVDDLHLLLKDLSILEKGFAYLLKGYTCTRKQMIIQPETTDNFGNRLMNNHTYIPVILSYSADAPKANEQFSNAISDFQTTHKFVFKTTNEADLLILKTNCHE
jgi:hypothetical protein